VAQCEEKKHAARSPGREEERGRRSSWPARLWGRRGRWVFLSPTRLGGVAVLAEGCGAQRRQGQRLEIDALARAGRSEGC
jgi:hypothetical protein